MGSNDPEYWPSRAEEARAVAAQMMDLRIKTIMLSIAQDHESPPSGPSTGGPVKSPTD